MPKPLQMATARCSLAHISPYICGRTRNNTVSAATSQGGRGISEMTHSSRLTTYKWERWLRSVIYMAKPMLPFLNTAGAVRAQTARWQTWLCSAAWTPSPWGCTGAATGSTCKLWEYSWPGSSLRLISGTYISGSTIQIVWHVKDENREMAICKFSGCATVSALPVFMQQQNQQPDIAEDYSTCLGHGKGPWYSRHTVKEKDRIFSTY